ncbi:MAG: LysE family translocator [Tannerellaceae bacterium]|nr:LysE family translocator [Tannerellaceae bacterium]
MLGLVTKGIVIGVLISAPMGPVGILCIQRTLNKDRWHGFVTGLGATLSDMIYAAITCLGMGVVVNFIEANQGPLQLIGSLLLGLFGYYIYKSNPVKSLNKQDKQKQTFAQDFLTAFLLTFSNVLIVLLYIGLFARFGFILPEYSIGMLIGGIISIGVGAILWWFGITFIVSYMAKWFNVRGIWILNKIVGIIIICLSFAGLLSVLLSFYFQMPLLQVYK